jgi:large subunit ribosomal protein L6
VSRKGKMPIDLPQGVEVTFKEGLVTVKGPKGTLHRHLPDGITVSREEGKLHVSANDEIDGISRLHGLSRALIENMVVGASAGFEKRLEMIGVGYRAAILGSVLDVQVGYSHPTHLQIPKELSVKVEKNTLIIISGIDKQSVGQFAAEVRSKRPPEPYQGKGIRYVGEYVRRKAGKAAKTAKKA